MYKFCYNVYTNCHHFGVKTHLLWLIVTSSYKILATPDGNYSAFAKSLECISMLTLTAVSSTYWPWDLEPSVLSRGAGFLLHLCSNSQEWRLLQPESALGSRPLCITAFRRSLISQQCDLRQAFNCLWISFRIDKIVIVQVSYSF